MRITSSGNVGIGTTSPGTLLDVNGTIRSRNGAFQLHDGTSSGGGFYFYKTITGAGSSLAPSLFAETGHALYFMTNGSASPKMILDTSGNVGIGTTSPAQKLHVVGEIVATSEITAYYSDERLKTKVNDVTNALDIVKNLNAFRYVNNETANSFGFNTDELQLGLSAQEVQKVVPEIVKLAPFDMERDENDNLISKSGEYYLTLDYAKLVPVLIEAIKEQQKMIEELQAKGN